MRDTDPVFAEIFRGYEMLRGVLPLDANDPTLEDVRDSPIGLEAEIRSHLNLPVSITESETG